MKDLPPEILKEFTVETWQKLDDFLNEFVLFTSHERARLAILGMLIDEKRHMLKEQMKELEPVTDVSA